MWFKVQIVPNTNVGICNMVPRRNVIYLYGKKLHFNQPFHNSSFQI